MMRAIHIYKERFGPAGTAGWGAVSILHSILDRVEWAPFCAGGEDCAGAAEGFEAILGDSGGRRCELRGPAGRGDGLPGAEWVRQIDHDEDDYRADRTLGGGDSVRRAADRRRSEWIQAADGVQGA